MTFRRLAKDRRSGLPAFAWITAAIVGALLLQSLALGAWRIRFHGWQWPVLLMAPACAFGAAVAERRLAIHAAGGMTVAVLPWMVLLAVLQLQYGSATWLAEEHARGEPEPRLRAVLGAALAGFADVGHLLAFKLRLLPWIVLWNVAWASLCAGLWWRWAGARRLQPRRVLLCGVAIALGAAGLVDGYEALRAMPR